MRFQILDGQLFRRFPCVLEYVRGAPGWLAAESWKPDRAGAFGTISPRRRDLAAKPEGRETLRASAWLRSSAGTINTDIHIAL